MTDNALTPYEPTLELAIAAWLDAKSKRSDSPRTAKAYRDHLQNFRSVLINAGLDLDSDVRPVSMIAQAWAGASKSGRATVSASTYNTRLAILSSFYVFAARQGMITTPDPTTRIERRSSQAYKSAKPISAADVKRKLADIDRSGVIGKRDYALLAVALNTGRRVTELASLTRGDLLADNKKVTLTFKRTKGGKSALDTLSSAVSVAVLDYLVAAYGETFRTLPDDAPLWISVSRANKHDGKGIGVQAIADICLKRLGTSKVHALRHTFAKSMLDSGAKVTDIQARLGHSSLTTTTRYLAELGKAENPYADKLAKLFGVT